MKEQLLNEFLQLVEKIGTTTHDQVERSGVARAKIQIRMADEREMEMVLKAVRDELFHYKGPFYDSFDHRAEMVELREESRQSLKRAINYYIRQRRPDLHCT